MCVLTTDLTVLLDQCPNLQFLHHMCMSVPLFACVCMLACMYCASVHVLCQCVCVCVCMCVGLLARMYYANVGVCMHMHVYCATVHVHAYLCVLYQCVCVHAGTCMLVSVLCQCVCAWLQVMKFLSIKTITFSHIFAYSAVHSLSMSLFLTLPN